MAVDHDMMLGRLFEDIHIVVVHRLRVVEIAAGDDVAHIAGLHGIIAILVHELEGILQVAFIVLGTR